MRAAAASSPALTAELAAKLSESEVMAIQEALAGNPVVPERIRVVARLNASGSR